jgi:hypothetical protein
MGDMYRDRLSMLRSAWKQYVHAQVGTWDSGTGKNLNLSY